MKFKFAFFTLALITFNTLFAQENTQFSKEFKISSGYGYSNGVNNATGSSSIFMQMSYQLTNQFSLATEFEHLTYRLPWYYPDLPIHPNVQNIFDDSYSLLIKYHLPLNAKLQATLASGWTFYTRQNEYYDFYKDATSQGISATVYSYSDFGIPFLLETNYPLWKSLGAGIHLKYNLNPHQGSTWSAGGGVSLKL